RRYWLDEIFHAFALRSRPGKAGGCKTAPLRAAPAGALTLTLRYKSCAFKRLWVRFADHALQNPGWYSNGGAAAQDQSHNVNA
ncbi:hypothetical protein, partial [Halomonas sp. 3F2F]|uniref:hypothetical protein n=1 Tax=Halomonas sp. 3F2F TaxID=1255602 RepID=UPI001867B772